MSARDILKYSVHYLFLKQKLSEGNKVCLVEVAFFPEDMDYILLPLEISTQF